MLTEHVLFEVSKFVRLLTLELSLLLVLFDLLFSLKFHFILALKATIFEFGKVEYISKLHPRSKGAPHDDAEGPFDA